VACGFFFVDEDKGCILWYTALENPRQHGISWTSPDLKEIDETTAIFVIEVREGWGSTNVPFEYGWVGIHHRATDSENVIEKEGWTEALSLGLRNLDFHWNNRIGPLKNSESLKETQSQLIMRRRKWPPSGIWFPAWRMRSILPLVWSTARRM
jgi:hypothetical protein